MTPTGLIMALGKIKDVTSKIAMSSAAVSGSCAGMLTAMDNAEPEVLLMTRTAQMQAALDTLMEYLKELGDALEEFNNEQR